MVTLFGDKVRAHHITMEGDYNQALPVFSQIESDLMDIDGNLHWCAWGKYTPGDATVLIEVSHGDRLYERVVLEIDDCESAQILCNRLHLMEENLYKEVEGRIGNRQLLSTILT